MDLTPFSFSYFSTASRNSRGDTTAILSSIDFGKCLRFPVTRNSALPNTATSINIWSLGSGSERSSGSVGMGIPAPSRNPSSSSTSVRSNANLSRDKTVRYSDRIRSSKHSLTLSVSKVLSTAAGEPCGDRIADTSTLVSSTIFN